MQKYPTRGKEKIPLTKAVFLSAPLTGRCSNLFGVGL